MTHIWTIEKWIEVLDYNNRMYRKGLRLVFDDGIDPILRNACKKFAVWLRSEYYFPVRVPIYFKNKEKLKCLDGDTAFGTFFEPNSYADEPYIRIAVGDFPKIFSQWGEDEAIFYVFNLMAHELTHYFQWINALQLTPIGRERQATVYAQYVTSEYTRQSQDNQGTVL